MNREELWQAILGELELELSRTNFKTWFKNTSMKVWDEGAGRAVIAVPNTFTKAWFEGKYLPAIKTALTRVTERTPIDVSIEIGRGESAARVDGPVRVATTSRVPLSEPPGVSVDAAKPSRRDSADGINYSYTFENFVVGKANELAKAAALAVTDKPGVAYNPLFIYGGSGLGKTHLLQAIGNKIYETTKRRALYVTCDRFTSDFIKAISQGRAQVFKDSYRTVDVLLIDDIQFLSGKEGTQEEFFHTFNALHQTQKQIVISSDRPPKAIPALENRLTTRFEWGMIVDISAPDLETRVAILKAKCLSKGITLSDEILHYIAANVQSNVRELEGALNRLVAVHQLNQTVPTLESAKAIFVAGNVRPRKGALTPRQILDTVSQYFDVEVVQLTGASRKKELVVPRQITMFLMREEIRCSYPSIGQELGGRDHTTAMHAYTKIFEERKSNNRLEQDIELIRERLYNSH